MTQVSTAAKAPTAHGGARHPRSCRRLLNTSLLDGKRRLAWSVHMGHTATTGKGSHASKQLLLLLAADVPIACGHAVPWL
jgi:hypothetical protein